MHPIFEHGDGKGIGLTLKSFSNRFDVLCREHLDRGRARAFAFIFYNSNDEAFRKILEDQGVFAKLDRLSGAELSVFYLASGSKNSIDRFNSEFLARLEIRGELQLPCVVFFDLKDKHFTDTAAVPLDSPNLIHGFSELYGVIQEYMADSAKKPPIDVKSPQWIKSGLKFIGVEVVRAFLKDVLAEFM